MYIDSSDSVARILALSALQGGQTDKEITVAETVGGIEAGTVYPEGTSIADIIVDLLGGGTPPALVKLYFGATDNKPASVSDLDYLQIPIKELISDEGCRVKIKAGNPVTRKGQYPTIGIPKAYSLIKWYVPGFEFDIPHTMVVSEDYNIYYLDNPSYDEDIGGIEYVLKIK